MCGNHSHPSDEHHEHQRVFHPRPRLRQLSRRQFLGDVGNKTLAVAILSPVVLAACSSGGGSLATVSTSRPVDPTAQANPTSIPENSADSSTEPESGLRWGRTNLGNVSAYVLARGTEAAIVDTGNPGSAEAIGDSLAQLGLTYSNVNYVFLTHFHGDHAGSIGEVLEAAPQASAYAGEADLAQIRADGLVSVNDGDEIFGLQMVHTPGHTAGHVSVWDQAAGVMVVGDALNGRDGGVVGANPSFSPDMDTANQSARKLATLRFDTLLFGHGEPVLTGADTAVQALAASL